MDELQARTILRRAPQGETAATVSRHAPFAEWAAHLGTGHMQPASQKELAAHKAAARRRAARMLELENKAAAVRKAEERQAADTKETRDEREKREKKEDAVQMKLFKMEQARLWPARSPAVDGIPSARWRSAGAAAAAALMPAPPPVGPLCLASDHPHIQTTMAMHTQTTMAMHTFCCASLPTAHAPLNPHIFHACGYRDPAPPLPLHLA